MVYNNVFVFAGSCRHYVAACSAFVNICMCASSACEALIGVELTAVDVDVCV